jgi:deoxyribodipyrimidine photo-lyase
MGCISPRTIYKEIRAYEKENGEWFYVLADFELLWRDFFRFMFKKYQTKFFLYGV